MQYCVPVLAAGFLLSGVMSPVYGAAWTQEKGKTQVITSYTYDTASAQFNDNGSLTPVGQFEKTNIDVYAQYGLKDGLTLILSPGYEYITSDLSGVPQTQQGLNHTGIGGRLRIWEKGRHIISVEGTYYLPGEITTTDTTVLSRGGGDIDGRLLYGGSRTFRFRKKDYPAFWDIQLGYRQRDGGPSHEVHGDVTLGVQTGKKTQVMLQNFNILGLDAGSSADALWPQVQIHKVQASSVYRLSDRFRLQAGGYRTLFGKNVVQENAFFGAIWVDF